MSTEVLVKWKSLSNFEATWEVLTDLKMQFLNHQGRNDRPQVHVVYQRTKFERSRQGNSETNRGGLATGNEKNAAIQEGPIE